MSKINLPVSKFNSLTFQEHPTDCFGEYLFGRRSIIFKKATAARKFGLYIYILFPEIF